MQAITVKLISMNPQDAATPATAPAPANTQPPAGAVSPTATAAVYTSPASQLIVEPGRKRYLAGTLSVYADHVAFAAADSRELFNLPYASVSRVRFSKWGPVYIETPDGTSRQLVVSARARNSSVSTYLVMGGTVLFVVVLRGVLNAAVPQSVRDGWYFGPALILVGLALFAALYVKYGLPAKKKAMQLRSVISQYVKVA